MYRFLDKCFGRLKAPSLSFDLESSASMSASDFGGSRHATGLSPNVGVTVEVGSGSNVSPTNFVPGFVSPTPQQQQNTQAAAWFTGKGPGINGQWAGLSLNGGADLSKFGIRTHNPLQSGTTVVSDTSGLMPQSMIASAFGSGRHFGRRVANPLDIASPDNQSAFAPIHVFAKSRLNSTGVGGSVSPQALLGNRLTDANNPVSKLTAKSSGAATSVTPIDSRVAISPNNSITASAVATDALVGADGVNLMSVSTDAGGITDETPDPASASSAFRRLSPPPLPPATPSGAVNNSSTNDFTFTLLLHGTDTQDQLVDGVGLD